MNFIVRLAALMLVGLLFGFTEYLRYSNASLATTLSLIGWGVFFLGSVISNHQLLNLRAAVSFLFAALFSLIVISLFLNRSHFTEIGIHVDTIYTFQGLEQTFKFNNPVSQSGLTSSYPEFALQFLMHIPAVTLGFSRFWSYAPIVGPVLILSFLIASIVCILAERDTFPGSKCIWVGYLSAAISALYCNRFLLQSINNIYYALPPQLFVLCITIFYFEKPGDPKRGAIPLFVSVALLCHYVGLAYFVPLIPLYWWILLRDQQLDVFFREQWVLLATLVLTIGSVSARPELLFVRVADVSLPGFSSADFSLFLNKILSNWHSLPQLLVSIPEHLFKQTSSWFMVDLPIFGGPIFPCLVTGLFILWKTMGNRILKWFAGGFVYTVTVTFCICMFSDLSERRLLFIFYYLGFFPLMYVVCLLRVESVKAKFILCATMVVFAAINFIDISAIQGRHVLQEYNYSPEGQRAMEALREALTKGSINVDSDAKVLVAGEDFFALGKNYVQAFHDVFNRSIELVTKREVCSNSGAGFAKRLETLAQGTFLVISTRLCSRENDWKALPVREATKIADEVYLITS